MSQHTDPPQVVIIRYRNHRGEVADRRISPLGIRFASTDWHPDKQWIMDAMDRDKKQERSFTLRDILVWDVSQVAPAPGPATEEMLEWVATNGFDDRHTWGEKVTFGKFLREHGRPVPDADPLASMRADLKVKKTPDVDE